MKRLIFKSLFIFLFLFILNILYIHTNYWEGENNVKKFFDMPYNLELVNVGSSHGVFDIKYDVVPEIKAWNLALSAQPYFYDLQILKHYSKHFAKDAIILIPISYFGITGREQNYADFRSRYYRILSKQEMDFWSLNEYIFYKLFPILTAKENSIRIFCDKTEEEMSPYYNRYEYLDNIELKEYCIRKYKSWISKGKGKSGFLQNIQEISATIDFCYENNFRPVLISTPITDILNEIYVQDGDFFPTFKQFSDELCKKYPNICYFDYSRDERFSAQHELFADGDHLNNFGAEKFTKQLISDLKARKLLK